MSVSNWTTELLGESALGLREAVASAIPRAHEFASSAQAASGTRKRDTYGHTLKNRQHECLVEAGLLVDGVEAFHPHGASFELLRVTATRTVLFPWRYATSTQTARVDARMRTSVFRTDLLCSGAASGQLTLDHAGLSNAELEEQLAADATIADELRRLAPVVTIGYLSNPSGLHDLGWGRAELQGSGGLDGSGVVHWTDWEPLLWLPGAQTDLAVTPAAAPRAFRTVVAPAAATEHVSQRFDQSTALVDDLGLRPRVRVVQEPSSEKTLYDSRSGAQDGDR